MDSKVLTNDKSTTLNKNFLCGVCGEPAMTEENRKLRCPSCWLKEKGQKINPLDHAGYYP